MYMAMSSIPCHAILLSGTAGKIVRSGHREAFSGSHERYVCSEYDMKTRGVPSFGVTRWYRPSGDLECLENAAEQEETW